MTLLTIEKEQFLTIKGARFNKEDQAVLLDMLEKIQEHVLAIEQNTERLSRPPIDVAVHSIVQSLSDLNDSDIPRMEHHLPYLPKEPLESLRSLGSCLLQKASEGLSKGTKEFAPLQESATLLVKTIDKTLSDSYTLPHKDEILLLDKQIFASCKRICQTVFPPA